jgi:Ulp1 family protease
MSLLLLYVRDFVCEGVKVIWRLNCDVLDSRLDEAFAAEKESAHLKMPINKETSLSYLSVVLSGENLTQCVTVSTKIPKQLKEKVQRFKIKPAKILRKALEDEVKKREMEELKDEINKLKPILEKVSMDDVVKSIREDRNSR